MPEMKEVNLFTDGSCLDNPGPGGYGVILHYQEYEREFSGGCEKTTNNRMELLAAIKGLRALNYPCKVTLYTDSKYVADGISKGWAALWEKRGWIKSNGQPASNPDLWKILLQLCSVHDVKVVWVKGHAGHPENERCDKLAIEQAQKYKMLVEKQNKQNI